MPRLAGRRATARRTPRTAIRQASFTGHSPAATRRLTSGWHPRDQAAQEAASRLRREGTPMAMQDAARYQANWRDEFDSAALYRTLATAESRPELAEVYR